MTLKYSFDKSVRELHLYVKNQNGEIVWKADYPSFVPNAGNGELDADPTLIDLGIMKNVEDVQGLASHLMKIGVMQEGDMLVDSNYVEEVHAPEEEVNPVTEYANEEFAKGGTVVVGAEYNHKNSGKVIVTSKDKYQVIYKTLDGKEHTQGLNYFQMFTGRKNIYPVVSSSAFRETEWHSKEEFAEGGEVDKNTYATIWSKNPGSNHWLLERSHPLHYIFVQLGKETKEGEEVEINGRKYAWFTEGINPNGNKLFDQGGLTFNEENFNFDQDWDKIKEAILGRKFNWITFTHDGKEYGFNPMKYSDAYLVQITSDKDHFFKNAPLVFKSGGSLDAGDFFIAVWTKKPNDKNHRYNSILSSYFDGDEAATIKEGKRKLSKAVNMDYDCYALIRHNNKTIATVHSDGSVEYADPLKKKFDKGGQFDKGLKAETHEHSKTFDKLYHQEITPNQAVKEVVQSHLDEKPDYYNHYSKGGDVNRFFEVTYTENWIETPLDYQHGANHADVAEKLPLKSHRITNERFREIETTGKYYRITEIGKGGKSFIFEIDDKKEFAEGGNLDDVHDYDQYKGTIQYRNKPLDIEFEIISVGSEKVPEGMYVARLLHDYTDKLHKYHSFLITKENLARCTLIKKYNEDDFVPSFLKSKQFAEGGETENKFSFVDHVRMLNEDAKDINIRLDWGFNNKYVTLYHGTSKTAAEQIKKTGFFKDGFFFSKKSNSEHGDNVYVYADIRAHQAGEKGKGEVITMMVSPDSFHINRGTAEFESDGDLYLWEDGVWRNRKEEDQEQIELKSAKQLNAEYGMPLSLSIGYCNLLRTELYERNLRSKKDLQAALDSDIERFDEELKESPRKISNREKNIFRLQKGDMKKWIDFIRERGIDMFIKKEEYAEGGEIDNSSMITELLTDVNSGKINADDAAIKLDESGVEVSYEVYDQFREAENNFKKGKRGLQVGDTVMIKGKNGNSDFKGNFRGITTDGKYVVVGENGHQSVYDKSDLIDNKDSFASGGTIADAPYKYGDRVEFIQDSPENDTHASSSHKWHKGDDGFIKAAKKGDDGKFYFTIQKNSKLGISLDSAVDVPEDHLKLYKADVAEKVTKILDEKQKTKEFKDVGKRVAGSKKEQRAYASVTFADLEDIEMDEITAQQLVVKDKVFAEYNIAEQRAAGVSAGAAYLKTKLRDACGSKPPNKPLARAAYTKFIEVMVQRTTPIKTVAEMKAWFDGVKNMEAEEIIGYFVDPKFFDFDDEMKEKTRAALKKAFLGASSYTIMKKLLEETFGKRFSNFIYMQSDPAREAMAQAILYEAISPEQETANMVKYRDQKQAFINANRQNIEDYKNATPEVLKEKFSGWSGMDRFKKDMEGFRQSAIDYYQKRVDSGEEQIKVVPQHLLQRSDDWSWFDNNDKQKEVQKSGELRINTGKPLDFIKRTGGIKISEEYVEQSASTDPEKNPITGTFGFKSVQYGNALKNNEAREHVRHFLGAMADIAEILNVDLKHLNSIGGLSIAFAARGGGSFACATYERGRCIINLTNKRGDGVVAHEFGHYFDNAITMWDQNKSSMEYGSAVKNIAGRWGQSKLETFIKSEKVTNAMLEIMNFIYKGKEGITPKIPEHFEAVAPRSEQVTYFDEIDRTNRTVDFKETIDETFEYMSTRTAMLRSAGYKYPDYQKRLIGNIIHHFGLEEYEVPLKPESSAYFAYCDRMTSKYWTKHMELFARAWETYIYDKLESAGRMNNYLVSGSWFNMPVPLMQGGYTYVYPFGDERKYFITLFDDLIRTVKEEYHLGDFIPFSDVRADEYIVLQPDETKMEEPESGVVVTKADDTKEEIAPSITHSVTPSSEVVKEETKPEEHVIPVPDKKYTKQEIKEQEVIARQLGKEAFHAKKSAVPHHDEKLTQYLAGNNDVNSRLAIYKAWSSGWHGENSKTAFESIEKEEQKEQAPAATSNVPDANTTDDKKVGYPYTLEGVECLLSEWFIYGEKKYELYKPTALKDERGFIRIAYLSGEFKSVVKGFQTFSEAFRSYSEIKKVQKANPPENKLTYPAAQDEEPPVVKKSTFVPKKNEIVVEDAMQEVAHLKELANAANNFDEFLTSARKYLYEEITDKEKVRLTKLQLGFNQDANHNLQKMKIFYAEQKGVKFAEGGSVNDEEYVRELERLKKEALATSKDRVIARLKESIEVEEKNIAKRLREINDNTSSVEQNRIKSIIEKRKKEIEDYKKMILYFQTSYPQGFAQGGMIEHYGHSFPGYNKPINAPKGDKHKKMVLVKKGDKIKLVKFGLRGMEDYTQHGDEGRRENFLRRSAGIVDGEGNLTKDDPFSANYWSRRHLWASGEKYEDGGGLEQVNEQLNAIQL